MIHSVPESLSFSVFERLFTDGSIRFVIKDVFFPLLYAAELCHGKRLLEEN